MCGVVGICSTDSPVSRDALDRATRRLFHRGPDGQRIWTSPNGRVGLGHARLSIIDLSTGDQPLSNEAQDVWAVVNGEFYDFERIRGELVSRGHEFRTGSDSEILLHLYEDMGLGCMHELRGEFAFVLWDERNQMLVAGRDRFGIKPLYYSRFEDAVFVASEAKALFAAGVPARWDYESYFQLNQAYLDGDRSLFEGVYQVPPGHYLIASRGHVQVLRYWDYDFPTRDHATPVLSDVEYVEELRQKLEESVRLRLRADVPVGCYLSGGIDSQAILGIATKHTSNRIETFTVCFTDDPKYDERPIAQEMADRVGANFNAVPITSDLLADNLSEAVCHVEMIPNNESGVAKYMLSRRVREAGLKVVLTGEGADETFAGYAHFRRDMFLHNMPKAEGQAHLQKLTDANKASAGWLIPAGDSLPLESVQKTLGFVPSCLENFAGIGARMRAVFSEDFIHRFRQTDPFRVFLNRVDVNRQLADREPLNQSLYLWAKTMMPHNMLQFAGDRSEMAHSVEGRVPFLDHHVVELAARRMPVSLKIRGSTEKYVLREAVRPFVTETVYRREKHPFAAPPSKPGSKLQTLIQDTLRSSVLTSVPFFDRAGVLRFLDKLPEMQDVERIVWNVPLMRILGTCFLQDRYHL